VLLLAACAAPPPLRAADLDLGGPGGSLHYTDDGTLLAVADGVAVRVAPGASDPEVLRDGVETAVPVRRTGETVLHTTTGEVVLLDRRDVEVGRWENLFDVDGLIASEQGDRVVWNDQYLHVHVLDLHAGDGSGELWQLYFDGHLLGLTPDAEQILLADGMWLNWYFVYLNDWAHAIPVRYPAGDLVGITLVGRDARYAEVLPGEEGDWLVVADGDGNTPVAAVTAGEWSAGAMTADGAAVLMLEQDGKDSVLTRYTGLSDDAEELGRGRWAGAVLGPAAAPLDRTALAVATDAGVTIFRAD
jgi:hypothetical protein